MVAIDLDFSEEHNAEIGHYGQTLIITTLFAPSFIQFNNIGISSIIDNY